MVSLEDYVYSDFLNVNLTIQVLKGCKRKLYIPKRLHYMQHAATTQVSRPFESEYDPAGHALQAEIPATARTKYLRCSDAPVLRPEVLCAVRRQAIYDGGHAVVYWV